MTSINLNRVLEEHGSCADNSRSLRGVLLDLYPDSQERKYINVIVAMMDKCGGKAPSTPLELSVASAQLENDGFSSVLISECSTLWRGALFNAEGRIAPNAIIETGLNSELGTRSSELSISIGSFGIVGVRRDGRVLCSEREFDVDDLTNIKKVLWDKKGKGFYALKSDGTVVYKDPAISKAQEFPDYLDCVDIGMTDYYDLGRPSEYFREQFVGVHKDGRVCLNNSQNANRLNFIQAAINSFWDGMNSWRDIKQIACGSGFVAGLSNNGSVVASGPNTVAHRVAEWEKIKMIVALPFEIIGLKADGTVISTSPHISSTISEWRSIVSIAASHNYVFGLTNVGRVLCSKYNSESDNILLGQSPETWKNVISIFAGVCHLHDYIIGIQNDGKVVSNLDYDLTNYSDIDELNIRKWNLLAED